VYTNSDQEYSLLRIYDKQELSHWIYPIALKTMFLLRFVYLLGQITEDKRLDLKEECQDKVSNLEVGYQTEPEDNLPNSNVPLRTSCSNCLVLRLFLKVIRDIFLQLLYLMANHTCQLS